MSDEGEIEVGRSVPHCRGRRSDGERCGSTIVNESGWCFAHDPEATEDRRAARRRGGQASAKVVRIKRLAPPALIDVYERLEEALTQVHEGTLPPRRATAMASVARAMASVLQMGELEARIRAIEDRMGIRRIG
jgi:hypothetical protein